MAASETQLGTAPAFDFRDLGEGEFQRVERARAARARAALLRSAGVPATGELDLDVAPDTETQKLIADFGHTTDAANVLLAEYEDFTDSMARFANALVGLAGDRVDWFPAADELVASRAARSVKWVQTTRKDFDAWQKKRGVAVVDIEDHLYDPANGNQPHKYRVHLARLAAEATLDARASREWSAHPGRALEASAKNLRKLLPSPVHRKRKTDRPEDAAKQIKRRLKHMGTLMDRVEEIRAATGGQVRLDVATIEDLEKRLAVLKAAAVDPNSSNYKGKVLEMRRDRFDRREEIPAHHALRDLPPLVEESAAAALVSEGVEIISSPPPSDQADSTTCAQTEPASPAGTTPVSAETETSLYLNEWQGLYEQKCAAGLSEDAARSASRREMGDIDEWRARRLRE